MNDFDKYKCCVIVPTYNNCNTLGNVLSSILGFTSNVIVVNDGSDDTTLDIINSYEGIDIVSYDQNVGKGWALRKGFKRALELGYDYAITIDSDGQHSPADLPLFIDMLTQEPEAIIIGSRNMTQDGVPRSSSFGNKFSNFWFWVETGNKMPDTQSGFRLYPIRLMKDIKFFTKKFEFEIESMVKASWKGIKICQVPISIYYPPKDERISHFRPFKDFLRISILNTYLVTLSLTFYIFIRFFKNLTKENIKRFIKKHVFNEKESGTKKILSVSFGVFMGIVPIWGYQLIVAILLAYLFKLNKVLVVVAANISLPPMIPFILFGSYYTGGLFLGNGKEITFNFDLTFEAINSNLYQYLVGSIIFAIIMSIASGLLTMFLLWLYSYRKKFRSRKPI